MLGIGWITLALLGQEPPQTKVGALMEPSLERQRAAVRKQTPSPPGADAFFVSPAFFLPPPRSLGAPNVAAAGAECGVLADTELRPLATEAAQAVAVKPEWLLALVAEKSQGRPCALSPAGAAGLMQLAPATVDELRVADPFDPRQNLAAGARLLAQLIARYHGDFARSRAAYDGSAAGGPQAPGSVSEPIAPTAVGPTQNLASTADKNE
jgi:soluble lytic murein transglycosylase-like protein